MWHKVNFSKCGYNWFEFRVFLSLRLVALLRLENPTIYLQLSWENRQIYAFLKSISAKWNTNGLVQDWTQVTNSICLNNNHYVTKMLRVSFFV